MVSTHSTQRLVSMYQPGTSEGRFDPIAFVKRPTVILRCVEVVGGLLDLPPLIMVSSFAV